MTRESDEMERRVRADLPLRIRSPYVLDIDWHFAGYFNELGINVRLDAEMPPDQLDALAAAGLSYLNEVLPKDNAHFCWQLSFLQAGRQIGLFFPGDSPSDNCAGH